MPFSISKTCDTCRWAGCRHYGKANYGCGMWLMSHEEIRKRGGKYYGFENFH